MDKSVFIKVDCGIPWKWSIGFQFQHKITDEKKKEEKYENLK